MVMKNENISAETITSIKNLKDKDKSKITDVIVDIISNSDGNNEQIGKKVTEALRSAALWLG